MKKKLDFESLQFEAEDCNVTAHEESAATRLEAWKELVDAETVYSSEDDFAEKNIFTRAEEFLKGRIKDIQSGVCSSVYKLDNQYLRPVLSFDFSYTYEVREVNTSATSEEEAFEFAYDTDYLDLYKKQSIIIKLFKAYLLEGAAFAKKIASDAYPLWRKAIIDFEFEYHRFRDGLEMEKLCEYLKRVQDAAEMTHVDREVMEKLKKKPQKS